MKSVNQIFKNNQDLLDNDSVKELIDYCKELEDEIIDNKQQYSFEDKLTELVKELYYSINDIIEQDDTNKRFNLSEGIDYEESVKNLKKYLQNFGRDNHFYF